MSETKQLTAQEKQALEKEKTIPGRFYIPRTDIFETPQALRLLMDMPGVSRDNISINLERNTLEVTGRINTSAYEQLEPLYTEYNVGHFTRSFTLSNQIDQEKIEASLNDGVLTLTLPKLSEKQARRIEIQ